MHVGVCVYVYVGVFVCVNVCLCQVEQSFPDLQMEFEEMDPYRTGFVSPEEFKEVLLTLCFRLNEYECDVLARKFDVNRDGRLVPATLNPRGAQLLVEFDWPPLVLPGSPTVSF